MLRTVVYSIYAKDKQLTIQIPRQVSPEEARKEIVKLVNIAEEDPEIVSDCDCIIKLWKYLDIVTHGCITVSYIM